MKELRITARVKGGAEEYIPLAETQLTAKVQLISGDGSAAAPWLQKVNITAVADFEGVIRIAMPVAKHARFYLPGFMYGTNRGEAPLVVDSK